MTTKIYNGDCQEEMKRLATNSIDAIVTDPPYELNFMGKGWDNAGVSFNKETWKKCLRVLKPGGYLLAFGGTRTYHRIACAIEDAGFEIRDCIMWLYGSGFPKSMNISKALDKKEGGDFAKQWQGWGSALKPSYEPIIVARKPFKGSLVNNIMKHGVGGLNIDECRVEYEKNTNPATNPLYRQQNADKYKQVQGGELSNGAVSWTSGKNGVNEQGRFPANTILDSQEGEEWRRYFYCAKASKKDRDDGLEDFELKQKYYCDGRGGSLEIFGSTDGGRKPLRNIHPTVKPTSLMQYLIRLVSPKGATILDPFMGSGSTGKAVMYENRERGADYSFIGIEMNTGYCKIADARIKHAKQAKLIL